MSGGNDAKGAVGCAQSRFGHSLPKISREAAQRFHLRAALPESSLHAGKVGRDHVKRIADGRDATGASGTQDPLQCGGKHVGVFVGIDMRDQHTVGLQFADLRSRFRFNLIGINPAR